MQIAQLVLEHGKITPFLVVDTSSFIAAYLQEYRFV